MVNAVVEVLAAAVVEVEQQLDSPPRKKEVSWDSPHPPGSNSTQDPLAFYHFETIGSNAPLQ